MANLKEIVTKAVIGKTKKTIKEDLIIDMDNIPDTILGCWVINHNFNGYNNGGKVLINGGYDLNIWYAYENNTKTNVIARNFSYTETVNVKLRSDENLTDGNEIIVRSLTSPSVMDVKLEGSQIKLSVNKELGVEIVGDTKVRINVEDDYDDYDEDIPLEVQKEVDNEINEDYLNSVNQK